MGSRTRQPRRSVPLPGKLRPGGARTVPSRRRGCPTNAIQRRTAAASVSAQSLGIVYKDTGRYDAAAAVYGEALDLVTTATGVEHPCAAGLWHNLAGLAHAQGQPHQAEALATRAARLHARQLGPDHPEIARQLNNLAVVVAELHRSDEVADLRR